MNAAPIIRWLEATVVVLAGPGALRAIKESVGTVGETVLEIQLTSSQAASMVIGREGLAIHAIRGLANRMAQRLEPGSRLEVKVADMGGVRRPARPGWRRVEEAGRV